MAKLSQSVRSVFKTFDYHSFTIEAQLEVDLSNDLEMIKLMAERYDIDIMDDDASLDLFKADKALREFMRNSFVNQKAQIDKWPKKHFGLAQFQGESWE